MDYAQEQADEIEALDSIYYGYFDKLNEETPFKFRVAVDPEAAALREGDSAEPVRLEVVFPAEYPNVVPEIQVKYSHILAKHARALTTHLQTTAEELKGQVMVFMLVTAAKEWLEENQLSAAQDWGADDEEEEGAHDHKKADRNKAGLLKGVVGVTPVTEANFIAWRTKFEAAEEAKRGKVSVEMEEKLARPTGRQLFERDASLYMDTDVGFTDAALFEGEDLPDEEDEEDDEDSEDEEDGEGVDNALFAALGGDDLPDDDDDDDDDYTP